MALTAESLIPTISPYVGSLFSVLWVGAQFLLVLLAIGFGFILTRYNVKVCVREFTKGARTITHITRAREFTDRNTKIPKLQFFGYMGFFGHTINQPPNQCIIPYRGLMAKKMYDFIKKDGLYFPVENLVLGQRYDVPTRAKTEKEAKILDDVHDYADSLLSNYQVGLSKDNRIIYSLEGTGLEVSRDYEAEQAIENQMMSKAETFRNQKPSVLYAMYGLAIILAIGSFITMLYGWNQFGNVGNAINNLQQPLHDGITQAVQQKLGPG